MKYKVVLFDFDGTVADSEDAGLEVMNALAGEFGYVPLQQNELRTLRKKSARELISSRLGIPIWKFWTVRRLERRGREELAKRASSINVFAGTAELIQGLRRVARVGVLSSNSNEMIREVLTRNGIEVDFIEGGISLFSKARGIRGALAREGTSASESVYVGDELRDVEACKKVPIDMIAVAWGLNDEASLRATGASVAKDSQELLAMIQR